MKRFENIRHTIHSCYLCIKYPFLYPRNRWSNRHYTNSRILDKRKDIYCKWSDYSSIHKDEYYNRFGEKAFFNSYKSDDDFVLSEYVLKMASLKDKFLYWWYGFYHNVLEFFHCIPSYTELDIFKSESGEGWCKAFGVDFSKDLKDALIEDIGWVSMVKDFRITQMKEKYGKFECYTNYYTPNVKNVINKYKRLSKKICIDCGSDATKKSMGYVCPYCDDCIEKHHYRYFKYINPKNADELKHNDEVDNVCNDL